MPWFPRVPCPPGKVLANQAILRRRHFLGAPYQAVTGQIERRGENQRFMRFRMPNR
jgi:hypothetical protein